MALGGRSRGAPTRVESRRSTAAEETGQDGGHATLPRPRISVVDPGVVPLGTWKDTARGMVLGVTWDLNPNPSYTGKNRGVLTEHETRHDTHQTTGS